MANTFSSTQISQMQTDLNSAEGLLSDPTAANLKSAISDLSAYYQVQFGFNGYSELAYQVVNNINVYGLTANRVLSFDNITYGTLPSVQLIYDLASNNLTDIIADNGLSPTESQIETEHEDAYAEQKIPIQFWGAAAFSNANENWIGSTATTQELSDTINAYFDGLSSSVIDQNLEYVFAAGFESDYNILKTYHDNPNSFSASDPSDNSLIKSFFQNWDGISDLIETPTITNYLNEINAEEQQMDEGFGPVSELIENDLGVVSTAGQFSAADLTDGSITSTIGNGNIQFSLSGATSDVVFLLDNNASYVASLAGQIVLASGGSDDLTAGANSVSLVISDAGGTNILDAGSFSNATEVVVLAGTSTDTNVASEGESDAPGQIPSSGTDPSTNVFSFSSGTNVLIGDSGNNTFVAKIHHSSDKIRRYAPGVSGIICRPIRLQDKEKFFSVRQTGSGRLVVRHLSFPFFRGPAWRRGAPN